MTERSRNTYLGEAWVELAEAFAAKKITEIVIPCPTHKAVRRLRLEFHSFRKYAKDIYPEFAAVSAEMDLQEDGTGTLYLFDREVHGVGKLLKDQLLKQGLYKPTEKDDDV